MNEIAISVKNLTKTYRIFGHPADRIKQALTFGRVRFHREFTAVQDVSCHPQLQKLMDALPSKPEIDGLKIADRDCIEISASIIYGTDETGFITFALTPLKHSESTTGPLGAEAGQSLLDTLRRTTEIQIATSQNLIQVAAITTDPSLDTLQRAQLPREFTLPNGAKAMAGGDDSGGYMNSVMGDRHILAIGYNNIRSNSTDEAVAVLTRLASEVHYDKLK